MNEHIRTPEQPSTPQQAEEIFKLVAQMTTLKGKQYKHASAFGEDIVKFPKAVAEHLPTTEEDSLSVSRTIYITQELDHETGQPRRTGDVANLSFGQKEKRDEDLGYWTNVNYHVVSDDGKSYRLERHVTSGESGKAYAARMAGKTAFSMEAMEQNLAELKDLLSRVEETNKVEAALGLTTVSNTEAEQILESLNTLNQ